MPIAAAVKVVHIVFLCAAFCLSLAKVKKVGRRDKVEETLFGGITNVFSINRPKVLRKLTSLGQIL